MCEENKYMCDGNYLDVSMWDFRYIRQEYFDVGHEIFMKYSLLSMLDALGSLFSHRECRESKDCSLASEYYSEY